MHWRLGYDLLEALEKASSSEDEGIRLAAAKALERLREN
jgi:hypothetical protein